MRVRTVRRAFAVMALLAGVPACNNNGAFQPGNTGTVIVHVVDGTGSGVADALIRLQLRSGIGGTFFLDGRTKPDGVYSYGGVEAGLVPVSVTPPAGYGSSDPLFKTLSVAGGDTTQTTFVLTKN